MPLAHNTKLPTPPMDGELQRLNAALRHSYTRQSATYDARRTVGVNGRFFFKAAYRAIDELIDPTNEDTFHVDMPVGTGRFLRYLRDHGRRHQMMGIDLSPGMLETCRQKTRHHGEVVQLLRADAFRLPLTDNSVDVLTSMRFFHLFPRRYWPALLGEMHRVIRPGGFVIAELRNQLRGVAGAWIVEHRDRWFRGGRRRSYAWPHQIARLFRAWGRVETRGAGLDGLGRLWTVAPRSAHRLHGLTKYAPWRYLAKELLIKAYKPS